MDNSMHRSLSPTIKEILTSPDGRRFYRERQDKLRRIKTGEPRKGSWREALKLHRLLLFRLKKYGQNDAEAALHVKLKACRSKKRCCDAACPKCSYAMQGVMAELQAELSEVGIVFGSAITIVPPLRILPSSDKMLCNRAAATAKGVGTVTKFRDRMEDTFDLGKVSAVLGAIDFDFSEFPQGQFDEHCRPHFHGVGFTPELVSADKLIRQQFPSKGSVFGAVEIKPYDGSATWVWYVFKLSNSRKVRKEKEGDGMNPGWDDADYKALTVEQHLQQTMLIHELGWEGRFFMRCVELRKNSKGYWRLVLSSPLSAASPAREMARLEL